ASETHAIADDHFHRFDFGRHAFHRSRRRILCAATAGHDWHAAPREHRKCAHDFHLARTPEPVALHPDRLQQTELPIGGRRAEILPDRRHVRRLHAVWLEPALRAYRRDRTAQDRGEDHL